MRVFDETVAVFIGGQHFLGPSSQLLIVNPGPSKIPFSRDIAAGRQEKGRERVERIPGSLPRDKIGLARLDAVADHAIALGPGKIAVERHPDEIKAGQSLGQRRRACGEAQAHVESERHRVARRVVGQHLDARIDLEKIEIGTAKAVEKQFGSDPWDIGMNLSDLERVFDPGPVGRRSRESNADEWRFEIAARVVLEDCSGRAGRDAHRAHIGQMEDARQSHASFPRLHQAEQRGVVRTLIESKKEWRPVRSRHEFGSKDNLFLRAYDCPNGGVMFVRGSCGINERPSPFGLEPKRPALRIFFKDGVPAEIAAA